MGKLKIYLHLLKFKAFISYISNQSMSAALFCSITMAVKRAAVASPVAAAVAVTASPRRAMSDDGKGQAGSVSSAGGSFAKKEKAEEAKYFKKKEAEQLEKLHKEKEEKEKEDKKKEK